MITTCERCGTIIHQDTHDYQTPTDYRLAMNDKEYLTQQKKYLEETTKLFLERIEYELVNTKREEQKIIEILNKLEERKKQLAKDFHVSVVGDYRKWTQNH